MTAVDDDQILLAYDTHDRLSDQNRLVYPVVSRRSRGLSLGINVNPDKRCNFDCVYCQVDRSGEPVIIRPDLLQLEGELRFWLHRLQQGDYKGYELQDIALAGDGEPTSEKQLPQVLELLIRLKQEYGLADKVKLVLFSNGSGIDRKDLKSLYPQFFAANGEVWFKLDYWDQQSLVAVNRTKLKFEDLIRKLRTFALQYPVVLQSCFFQWRSEPFSEQYYEPYVALVRQLLKDGIKLQKIQAYTLARKPSEEQALPWPDEQMNRLAALLRRDCQVPVELFYETGAE